MAARRCPRHAHAHGGRLRPVVRRRAGTHRRRRRRRDVATPGRGADRRSQCRVRARPVCTGKQSGTHLIAHELAHVAQQRAGGGTVAQAKSLISSPSDSAEIAADAAAARVASGGTAGLSASGLNTRGRIMRRARMGAHMPAMSIATPTPMAGAGPGAARPSATMTGLVSPAGDRPAATVGAAAGSRPARAGRRPWHEGIWAAPCRASSKVPTRRRQRCPHPKRRRRRSPSPVLRRCDRGGRHAGRARHRQDRRRGDGEEGRPRRKPPARKRKRRSTRRRRTPRRMPRRRRRTSAPSKQKKKRKFGQDSRRPRRQGGQGGHQADGRARRRHEQHEPAGQRVEQAQGAAAPPANEGAALADNTKINEFSAAEPPPPDPEAARAALLAAVEKSAPATMEDMDDMEGRSAGIGEKLGGTVKGQAGGVDQSLAGVKETPAPEEVPPAGEQPPGAEAAPTADPELAAATPPAVPDSTVDASEFKEEADSALSEQDIDDENPRQVVGAAARRRRQGQAGARPQSRQRRRAGAWHGIDRAGRGERRAGRGRGGDHRLHGVEPRGARDRRGGRSGRRAHRPGDRSPERGGPDPDDLQRRGYCGRREARRAYRECHQGLRRQAAGLSQHLHTRTFDPSSRPSRTIAIRAYSAGRAGSRTRSSRSTSSTRSRSCTSAIATNISRTSRT